MTVQGDQSSDDTLASLGLQAAARAQRAVDVAALELARARSHAALFDGPAPSVKIGRYVLLDRIGRGAMGVVYSAYDPELDRKVAIKLIATHDDDGSRGRARWLREAQALARLAHPNVVTVHDVGTLDDTVWIAMELVEGRTLSAWLGEAAPGVAQRIDVLLRVGAGLAAAHRAGLVNRDVKPENVMITSDDSGTRVLVMDFGLARSAGPTGSTSENGEAAEDVSMSGEIAGTPAYMAPEQHLGLTVDGRSDQFGFCVMAWETLYGERPFAGSSLAALAMAICAGERRPAPHRGVPVAIRVALERGLAVDPDARFPDMDALLAAIERGRKGRRRRIGVAVGITLVAGAAGPVLARARAEQHAMEACREDAESVQATWNQTGRDALSGAFAATGSPLADAASSRVIQRLDAWAESWRTTAASACVADASAPDARHARVRACLDERRHEVEALLDVLTHPEAADVMRAVEAVAVLERPESCTDEVPRLDPPPSADEDAIRGVRHGFGRVAVLRAMGRYAEARDEAAALLERAQTIGWPILVAEARYEAAVAIELAGDPAAAEPLLVACYMDALASGRDALAIDAAFQLTFVVGYELRRLDEGLIWGRHGESLVERAQASDLQRAQLSSSIATVLFERGDLEDAVRRQREIHRVFLEELGAEHPQIATALANLAMTEAGMGDHAAAEAHYREALALVESNLGVDHPHVATALTDLAITLATRGDVQGSLPLFERALSIRERALGPDHPLVATALGNLAGVRGMLGDGQAAEELLRRCIAILEAKLGPDHPDLAAPLVTLGGELQKRGALDEAHAALTRALELRERSFGASHPSVAEPAVGLATIALALDRPEDAIALAERAVELQRDAAPLVIGHARFVLAQALDAAGRDRDRAIHLARQAAADLADEDPPTQRTEIEAWLRTHTRP